MPYLVEFVVCVSHTHTTTMKCEKKSNNNNKRTSTTYNITLTKIENNNLYEENKTIIGNNNEAFSCKMNE